jgi:Ca2+/Na+ antiporter
VIVGGLAIALFSILQTNPTLLTIYLISLVCAAIAYLVISHRQKAKIKPPSTPANQSQPIGHNEDNLDNPLDYHIEIQVTENQLETQETIQVTVPLQESTFSIQLSPEIRNKKIRLRGVLAKGAGHLYVQICVVDKL